MKARELFNRRITVMAQAFAERVLWEVLSRFPVASIATNTGSRSWLRGNVLRYDNEAGKGDHKHVSGKEVKYRFASVDKLVADFFEDMKRWRDENSND